MKIGDKVRVITDRFSDDGIGKQFGRIGRIQAIHGTAVDLIFAHPDWPKGYSNSYQTGDLRLCETQLLLFEA